LPQAEQLYRQILAHQPQHADAMHQLGLIAYQVGQSDIAVDLIRRAIALNPNLPEPHSNLGNIFTDKGQLDEAIAACRQAIALRPDFPEAHINLGNALKDNGQLDEAIAAFRQAIGINPNLAGAHSNLGGALIDKGQFDEAITACQRAIAIRSNFPEAYNNLGNALKYKGHLDEAIIAYRQAIILRPRYAAAHNNLGVTLKDKGQLDEAIAAYRQAIALNPNYAEAHGNLIYILHFHPAYDAKALAKEHRRWNRQHAEPMRKFILPHSNDRNSDRRLRIGYVSPDFREHPVGRFLLPLLAHHDKNQVEVFGYSQVRAPDAMTQRLRLLADGWRNISGLSDAAAVDLIRQDQIDILVDLTMHMGDNRLLIFACKPAPVQVTYLAYCSSTGLETIDYRLSDPYLDPPEEESFYNEQTIHLPETYWCYQPIFASQEISPLPALARGAITFGCLNNFCKISQPTLGAWAKLLRAIPNSQLLLSAHEGSHRQRVQEQLQWEGIAPQRVRFVGKMPPLDYFRLYHEIDIALDTFPYAGGTTTCDALWMGVPTVSLCGQTAVGRGGLSILSNIGLPELVARSEDEYMRIAGELADNLPQLSQLRCTLRQRMEQSPLMDAPKFARNIEAAYRQMWRTWCETAATAS
jgi:predicted O-linked N-acetylglucosamine transferase (SPINDLY family)